MLDLFLGWSCAVASGAALMHAVPRRDLGRGAAGLGLGVTSLHLLLGEALPQPARVAVGAAALAAVAAMLLRWRTGSSAA